MAKKKNMKKQQVPKVFKPEDIQAALEILHSEYFMQTVALLSHDSQNKELAYVKVPVTTPEGGIYLVSILHIDGPKIDLTKLKEIAEAQEKEQSQEIKNP